MFSRNSSFYILCCFSAILSACTSPKQPVEQVKQAPVEEVKLTEIQKPDITIAAVGDIMLGTNYPDNRLAPDDGKNLLSKVKDTLSQADITFGNLEGVLLEGGEAAKKCKNPVTCYVFRSPPHYAGYLKDNGFDVLSTANNHARDFGEEGRGATMATLDEYGLKHTGRLGDVAYVVVNGVKTAFIAYAPFGGSHDMLDIKLAKRQVASLAEENDIVVVSFHGGAEGKDVLHVPFQTEMFYGEDRGDVVEFSRAMIDSGADLVIGHGPHVPRALELYRERLIAYSLGNFATYQGIRITGPNGLAPILKVLLAPDGSFKNGSIISTRQFRPQGNQLDNSHRAAMLMQRLTREDFPATPLEITNDGQIKIRVIGKQNQENTVTGKQDKFGPDL